MKQWQLWSIATLVVLICSVDARARQPVQSAPKLVCEKYTLRPDGKATCIEWLTQQESDARRSAEQVERFRQREKWAEEHPLPLSPATPSSRLDELEQRIEQLEADQNR